MKSRAILKAALLILPLAWAEEQDDYYDDNEMEWDRTEYTLSYFPVAGVNLALYGMEQHNGDDHPQNQIPSSSDPFEIFEDFHIEEMTEADEGNAKEWHAFYRYYKRNDETPTLSFYNDKVAFKKWIQSIGIDLPRIFLLAYVSELLPNYNNDESIEVEDLANAIFQRLPTNETDFVAKPSHQAASVGVWVISRDIESGTTHVSVAPPDVGICTDLEDKPDFSFKQLATSLAESILAGYGRNMDVAQMGPRPGIVIEERFTAFDRDDLPALEFKCFIIWGRLWVASWRRGGALPGFVNRDGTLVEGSEVDELVSRKADELPEWVDWTRVVEMAEQLGAHKDFVRVDIFAGIPAGPSALREGLSISEQAEAAQYVVSEISSTSSELLPAPMIDEFTRLWVAGYKIGDYRVIPNSEVPSDFMTGAQVQQQQQCSDSVCIESDSSVM